MAEETSKLESEVNLVQVEQSPNQVTVVGRVPRSKWGELISRKWLMAGGTIGTVVWCAAADVGLSAPECGALVVTAVAYIFGESWVDKNRASSGVSADAPVVKLISLPGIIKKG